MRRLQTVLNGSHRHHVEHEHVTIFEEYMNNKLPPSEKSEEVLFENAQMLVGAGFETTGFTLIVCALPCACESQGLQATEN